jgi:ferredoxin
MSVTVHFLPDKITVTAEPGEPLLNVADRAGITIPTGCLMGSCFACEVEIEGQENPIRACLASVPIFPPRGSTNDESVLIVRRYDDPIW